MKTIKFLIILLLCLLPISTYAGGADTTPPNIKFTLPTGSVVTPGAYGMVFFRAEAYDAGGIQSININIPHSSGNASFSGVTRKVALKAGWDTNDDQPGEYSATASAIDRAGNRATAKITFTLRK